MYVKVLALGKNRSATIYATDPGQPLEYGKERLDSDPTSLDYEGLTEALKTGSDSMDRTQVGSEPTGFYDHGGFWEVGWARFRKPDSTEVHLVAATSPIYLLDESGKTIERV